MLLPQSCFPAQHHSLAQSWLTPKMPATSRCASVGQPNSRVKQARGWLWQLQLDGEEWRSGVGHCRPQLGADSTLHAVHQRSSHARIMIVATTLTSTTAHFERPTCRPTGTKIYASNSATAYPFCCLLLQLSVHHRVQDSAAAISCLWSSCGPRHGRKLPKAAYSMALLSRCL